MTRIKELASVLILLAAPASGFAFQQNPNDTPAPGNPPPAGTEAPRQPKQGQAPAAQVQPGQTQTQPRPGQVQAQPRPGQVQSRLGQALAQPGQARFDDNLFVMVAADSGMAEVAVSRMAAERSENEQVKKLAQQLVRDHEKANQQLMAIAQTTQAPISRRRSPAKQAELAILAGKSGAEFDKAYLDQQLATHLCAVALFEAEAQQGQNPQLKQFASETLPTLQQHLKMVRQLWNDNSEK